MSRDFEEGSAQSLSSSSVTLTNPPLTIAAWINIESWTGDEQVVFGVHVNGSNFVSLRLDDAAGEFGSNGVQMVYRGDGTIATAQTTNDWNDTFGIWRHVCGVAHSTSDFRAFLDGTGKGTNTTTVGTRTAENKTRVGRFGNATDYFDGLIAWVTLWDVALSDAQVAQLALGLHPFSMVPQSITHLWPLYGDSSPEIDIVGSVNLTVNGAIKGSEHKHLFFPSAQILQFPSAAAASAAITGTATDTINESDIVTGGKTIIITLTGDTFKAAGTGPIGTTAETQALIDNIDSGQSEGTGWDAEVRDNLVPADDVVRTSSTVATINLPASASYDITAQETITVTVPTDVLVTGAGAITATPTFTVDLVSAAQLTAGSLMMMGVGI